jgi:hypothetical protein
MGENEVRRERTGAFRNCRTMCEVRSANPGLLLGWVRAIVGAGARSTKQLRIADGPRFYWLPATKSRETWCIKAKRGTSTRSASPVLVPRVTRQRPATSHELVGQDPKGKVERAEGCDTITKTSRESGGQGTTYRPSVVMLKNGNMDG